MTTTLSRHDTVDLPLLSGEGIPPMRVYHATVDIDAIMGWTAVP